jgi:hypothetical protein
VKIGSSNDSDEHSTKVTGWHLTNEDAMPPWHKSNADRGQICRAQGICLHGVEGGLGVIKKNILYHNHSYIANHSIYPNAVKRGPPPFGFRIAAAAYTSIAKWLICE